MQTCLNTDSCCCYWDGCSPSYPSSTHPPSLCISVFSPSPIHIATVATLGIVEFFIFLLHKYYEDLNIDMEVVFADVHFTLFYTALFNAFQSVVLTFFTSRASDRLWVQTEYQDLHHYLSIREEFDKVQTLLNGKDETDYPNDDENNNDDNANQKAESLFMVDIRHVCRAIGRAFRYPVLYRKYLDLLVQVRFHELKVQFLKENNVPPSFHVSSYLKRSEIYVMTELVHVSTFAWLLLTGAMNLLYFVMGMTLTVTEDPREVGRALSLVYLLSMVMSVVVSFIIFNKMKWIFREIMERPKRRGQQHDKHNDHSNSGRNRRGHGNRQQSHTNDGLESTGKDRNDGEGKLLDHDNDDSDGIKDNGQSEHTSGTSASGYHDQMALFWGGDPKLIIILIQFMQFGFAVGLSILLVFWNDIDKYYAVYPAWSFLVCVLLCYALFVYIMAKVIPRYTLCTSLGDLVNYRRLQESLAEHRLDEKKREIKFLKDRLNTERRHREASLDMYIENIGNAASYKPAAGTTPTGTGVSSPGTSTATPDQGGGGGAGGLQPDGTALEAFHSFGRTLLKQGETLSDTACTAMNGFLYNQPTTGTATAGTTKTNVLGPVPTPGSTLPLDAARLEQLVQTSTRKLRSPLTDQEQEAVRLREDRRKYRRSNRRKALSDGVDSMRRIFVSPSASPAMTPNASLTPSGSNDNLTKLGSVGTNNGAKTTDNIVDMTRRNKPRRRRKVVSASADIQSMRDATFAEQGIGTSGGAPPSLPPKPLFPKRVQRVLSDVVEETDIATSERTLPSVSTRSAALSPLQEDQQGLHLNNDSTMGPPVTSNNKNGVGTGGFKATSETAIVDAALTVATDDYSHLEDDDLPVVEHVAHVPAPPPPTLADRMRRYFRSRQYRLISAVFGTNVCFFFVAMRVEAILLGTGILYDLGNTFHFSALVSFYWELGVLSLFLLGDAIILGLFFSSRNKGHKDRLVCVSALLDIVLVACCVTILVMAEVNRCCNDDSYLDGNKPRFLAAAADDTDDAYKIKKPIVIECCPTFGSRLYGGVGNLEPFTALIALRLFRFLLARFLIQTFAGRTQEADQDPNSQTVSLHHPFSPFYSKNKTATRNTPVRASMHSSQKRGDDDDDDDDNDADEGDKQPNVPDKTNQREAQMKFHGQTGTIVELWQSALGVYPEIAKEHGEFSGELLKAMLGLETIKPFFPKAQMSPAVGNSGVPKASNAILGGNTSNAISMAETPSSGKARRRVSVAQQYSSLPTRTQSIILNGQTGKSVRLLDKSFEDSISLFGDSSATLLNHQAVFEVDDSDDDVSIQLEDRQDLVAPNATLIRNMRRCDRKVLPFLDEWTAVDVVMTKYELVFFEVDDNLAQTGDQKTRDIRDAIMATKGGKGLRLCDVAHSRKVVGHDEIDEIDYLQVERILARPSTTDGPSKVDTRRAAMHRRHSSFDGADGKANTSTRITKNHASFNDEEAGVMEGAVTDGLDREYWKPSRNDKPVAWSSQNQNQACHAVLALPRRP